MSNVISLRVPNRRQRLTERADVLATIFAAHRRDGEDVFWLKENAEFLNICECTGLELSEAALEEWRSFYINLPRRLAFFPQYYRFFLSIALDLEDLGLVGSEAETACAWVAREGLAEAELSDLQRSEARRLLARRGQAVPADPGIDDRLRAFIGRDATFTVPNKKAAYELTHIVFYLSEYGRRDPMVPEAALRSLEYAGLLALLEQNMDLLAEVCVALRYAGVTPSALWEEQVQGGLGDFSVETGEVSVADDYHEYLVSCWSARLAGQEGVAKAVSPERTRFTKARTEGPLRQISSILLDMDWARSGNWTDMRNMLYDAVDDDGRDVLQTAENSSHQFDRFFKGFARARA